MQKVNELDTKLPSEERTRAILDELDQIQQSMIKNGIEVRKALAILQAELKEKQNASR